MALVELAKFYNSFEASVAHSRLTSEGIESFLFDTQMNWGGLDGVVPVRLMVDEDDLIRGRRTLSASADEEGSG